VVSGAEWDLCCKRACAFRVVVNLVESCVVVDCGVGGGKRWSRWEAWVESGPRSEVDIAPPCP
jgi:hypothetical protein